MLLKNWIVPRSDDPLNRRINKIAGIIVLIEWALLFLSELNRPSCGVPYYGFVEDIIILDGSAAALLIVGIRGYIGAKTNRLGSVLLILTNTLILGVSVWGIIQNWIFYLKPY